MMQPTAPDQVLRRAAACARRWRPPRCLAGLLCLMLTNLATAAADELPARATHGQRPRFEAEVTAFVEAESSFVALQIAVPYAQLCFRKDPSATLRAAFDLIVHIFAGEREVLADAWHQELCVADRRELWGREQRFRRNLLFHLPPGPYRLELTLSEPGSGLAGTLRLGANVPFAVPGQFRLASLLVGSCGLAGRLVDLRADPRIRSTFYRTDEEICAYTELYHPGRTIDSLSVRWQLENQSAGESAPGGTARLPGGQDVSRLQWPLLLAGERLAAYRLHATVATDSLSLSTETTFSVQSSDDPPLGPFFRDRLGVLDYIAAEEEVRALRMAPPRDRQQVWEAFWAQRDPTPETEENEYKQEFFRRLNYADATFGIGGPGWRSDRGRIYIRHGEPDQIERYPYRMEGPPMEIWHYEQLGRTFVFLDERGYGNYELVSPE